MTSKQQNSAPISKAVSQAVAAYTAAKGADKVKLVNGLTAAMRACIDKGEYEKAGEINEALKAIDATKQESNKPKVSKAQLLANQAAVLEQALHMVKVTEGFDPDLEPTLSEADVMSKAAKLSTVRSVTRGAKGDRQGWIMQACAAVGDGNHTVNDLITKSGVAYPGSNTKPNGAVGDWHTTHEGETFDIEGGTMTVGFDSGHTDSEQGHRVFIVTMD